MHGDEFWFSVDFIDELEGFLGQITHQIELGEQETRVQMFRGQFVNPFKLMRGLAKKVALDMHDLARNRN